MYTRPMGWHWHQFLHIFSLNFYIFNTTKRMRKISIKEPDRRPNKRPWQQ